MFGSFRAVRKWAALTAFASLAVLPTAYVALTAYRVNQFEHPAVVGEALGAELEMEVELAGLRYPRRGEVLYEGLGVGDPESHRTLARCRTVRLLRGSHTLTLNVEGLEIASENPRLMLEHVDRLLG